MTTRSERRAVRLAWTIGMCSVALLVVALVLLVLDWKAIDAPARTEFQYFLQAPIVGILGVLIATRRPRNPIGWLLLAIAAVAVIVLVAYFIALRGLLSGASPRSWVGWPATVFGTFGTPGAGALLVAFVILFFPTGRLPGPRWRWGAWVVLAAGALLSTSTLLATTPIQLSPRLPSVANPLAVPALDGLTNPDSPVFYLTPMLLSGVLVAALVVRFRRSRDVERRQLRWFAFVGAAALGLVILGSLSGVRDVTNKAGFFTIAVLVPATIGLAVMRYRLYDLDIFISRTIVYSSLAVFITAAYVGIAVGIGTLVGSGGKPNLGLSILATAIVAVGFQPVRERVQHLANRFVYGKRATPYELLSQFSERVAESYATDDVLPHMARVLADATAAESAEVWLRSGHGLRRIAAFPTGTAMSGTPQLKNVEGSELSIPGRDRSVVVLHQGEVLGALAIIKRRGESITPIEVKLMDDLAHQAGLVLKNVGLTADLQARLVDLRASRQRLVAAQDDERRKLERNLHDGAQQHLVAIKVKLGLAEMFTSKDPEKAKATLAALKGDADEALETLRDLARGIYPPLLADKGLPAALRSQAAKATLPVTVHAEGVVRYPQETEAALYFCTLEALQNVQKYAQASAAIVRLRDDGESLSIEVADDGRGFDAASVARGAGLTNMEDRLDSLGGVLEVISTPGAGTTLRGSIPVTGPARCDTLAESFAAAGADPSRTRASI
ncbi:MAG: sensor histidine kinase [Candidatus Dormibacteraeota bacterium]|nr:sensor histidine kinase [Candidatus Dormibacteraeota bacterium]